MKKVDRNKQIKMDSLLDTAFNLFTTKGIIKTSISDIVNSAGVAKGTFYLYFKDKYDIRNMLVAHKSSLIFRQAVKELKKKNIVTFDDKIIFLADHVINQLNENQALLNFISKNLSWGIFKTALSNSSNQTDVNFRAVYYKMIQDAEVELIQPEVMLFMIVELISSTCYSAILYGEPVDLQNLKPYLYKTIRDIIKQHKKLTPIN